ncbi:hypothetical protein DICVIV_13473 [Dictyocaulus viviparus]|uniref:Uncharacterized protein n=1 Tax=Dictyocaulus viviparus TaxID=29172 RepID=A0A0D8X7Q0_DICVI|nr:hypothetical protein DICVIV_13473 [Dictyocaulus viviparus]
MGNGGNCVNDDIKEVPPQHRTIAGSFTLRLRREDAARLESQRRQEMLRNQEGQALLRANPL